MTNHSFNPPKFDHSDIQTIKAMLSLIENTAMPALKKSPPDLPTFKESLEILLLSAQDLSFHFSYVKKEELIYSIHTMKTMIDHSGVDSLKHYLKSFEEVLSTILSLP